MTDQVPGARELPFPSSEYEGRAARLRAGMDAAGVNLLLLHTPEPIYYLTGHQTVGTWGYQCLLFPRRGEPALVVRFMEQAIARLTSRVTDIVTYDDEEDPTAATARAVRERGWSRGTVGVEEGRAGLTVRQHRQLGAALPEARLADGTAIGEKVRLVKSLAEIEVIRQAARATERGMEAAVAAIAEGRTENDVAAAAARAMIEAGSEHMATQPFVTSGERSGVGHTTYRRRVLRRGDAVLLELCAGIHRYGAPLMRSACLGPPPDAVRRLAEVCLAGLEAAIAAIRPGVTSGEVDQACAGLIARAGFAENFRKRTGYSVGVGFPPSWGEGHIVSLQRNDPTVLEPGMVFHIPPALRDYGRVGVGISETVLVTPSGCEVITKFDRTLFVR